MARAGDEGESADRVAVDQFFGGLQFIPRIDQCHLAFLDDVQALGELVLLEQGLSALKGAAKKTPNDLAQFLFRQIVEYQGAADILDHFAHRLGATIHRHRRRYRGAVAQTRDSLSTQASTRSGASLCRSSK